MHLIPLPLSLRAAQRTTHPSHWQETARVCEAVSTTWLQTSRRVPTARAAHTRGRRDKTLLQSLLLSFCCNILAYRFFA